MAPNMNIEEVTEKARQYMESAGYFVSKVVKVETRDNKWIVTINAGSIYYEEKKVIIDDSTGKVVGFE